MSEPESQAKVVKINKSNPFLTFLVFLLLVGLVGSLAMFVILKNKGYDFKTLSIKEAVTYLNTENTRDEALAHISFVQDGDTDCEVYKSYIILLSKDGLKWYDKSGKLVQSNAMTLVDPVLKVSQSYFVVADFGGRDLYVYKDKGLLWSKKLDNQIINADISNNGYCTVVSRSKDYKSAVQVFDLYGVCKYTKLCAEDIVLNARIIDSGDNVLINKVTTDNIKTGTLLEFNNIYNEKPFSTVKVEESLLPIITAIGNNQLAVGTDIALMLDNHGTELWRKKLDSMTCVAMDSSKYTVLAGKIPSETKAMSAQIITIDSKGKIIYSFDQPEKIAGMKVYGDRVALRTQKSVFLYTLKGKKIGQYSSPNEIQDIYLTGKNEVIVICGGNISVVKI